MASLDSRVHGFGICLSNVSAPDARFEPEIHTTDASFSGANESKASGRSIIGAGLCAIDDKNTFVEGIPWQSSSDSYTVSTESSDKSHLRRRFSSTGSCSFAGSETDVFSPLWSSAENIDMPEVDPLNGNPRLAHDPLYMIDPQVDDYGEDGSFNQVTKRGEKLWFSQSSNASQSLANQGINTWSKLIKLESDSPHNDQDNVSNSQCSSGNVTELSFRIDSSESVCPSFDADVSKKNGIYLNSSTVSRNEKFSNSETGDNETCGNQRNDMDVKLIPELRDNCEKNLPQFSGSCNTSIDLCIDQGIPYYHKTPLRVSQNHQGCVSSCQGGNMNYCSSLKNGDRRFICRTFSHQVHSLSAIEKQEQSYEKLKTSTLKEISYEQDHLNSSSVPCEISHSVTQNGCMMPFATSHQTDIGSFMQHKKIPQVPSMAHDHHRYWNDISLNQNQQKDHYIQMGNSTLFQIKESMHPPFPRAGACPYVLCQSCCKILQVPTDLHVLNGLQKLKCSACQKTSRFSVVGHNMHPPSTNRTVRKLHEQLPAAHAIYYAQGTPKSHGCDEALLRNGRPAASYPYQADKIYSCSHKTLDEASNEILLGSHGSSESKREVRPETIGTRLEGRRAFGGHSDLHEFGGDVMQRDTYGAIKEAYVFSTSFNSTGCSRSIPSRSFASHGSRDVANYDEKERVSGPESSSSSFTLARTGVSHHKGSAEDSLNTHLGEIRGIHGGSYATANPRRGSAENQGTEKPWGIPPGSPLIEHFLNDPSHVKSNEGPSISSALRDRGGEKDSSTCSPAPGSPLFRHLSYDSMFDVNKLDMGRHCKIKNTLNTEITSFGKGSRDLARLLRKGIRELGKKGKTPESNGEQSVVVNGHIIPEPVLKRVEAQAGLIHPGTYWLVLFLATLPFTSIRRVLTFLLCAFHDMMVRMHATLECI
jgi:hypothetical protein